MRKILFTVIVLLSGLFSARADAFEEMEAAMRKAAASVTTLDCDFVQTVNRRMLGEAVVMKGHLSYSAPADVCWEYVSPYNYALIMTDSKVSVRNGEGMTAVDPGKSRIFKRVAKMMMGMAGESVTGNGDFEASVSESAALWEAVLTPKRKEMRRMFSEIVLRVDRKTGLVGSIHLKDDSGSTYIEFINVKTEWH